MGRELVQELGLPQVFEAIEQAFKANDLKRVEALLWPAVEQFPDISQLWFYAGCVFFKTGRPAVASQLFIKSIQLDDGAHVYSNLGACYRRMNLQDEGRLALQAALDRAPEDASSLTNMGSMFVNEGEPENGIPYLEKAVAIGTERGAKWNLGLLYLEAGRFGEGFDCYRTGVTHERAVRKYGKGEIPEPEYLTPEAPREGKTLIIWGEQGIGDELMMGTMLEDARRDFGRIIFECHPRLLELHRAAHPGMTLYPTRKDDYIGWPIADQVIADYKCPLGDLGALYRRSTQSFVDAWEQRGPTYRANHKEVESYREMLTVLAGGRSIVGLATRGGVMQTARTYRTIRQAEADYLFSNTDCLFVALDYDDMMGFANYIGEKYGEHRYKWWPSVVQHWDYDHTAALASACDLVVTVCQSVAHLSANLGLPTRVLTPKRCAWRYAPVKELPSDRWYWYADPAIKLYRQEDPESWRGPLERVVADINQSTQRAAA